MAEESEANKNKGNLFSSIGALVGMVAGGPAGAAIGGGLGSLLGGGDVESAVQSGIGSFLSAGLGGKAGMALNALNTFGGGGGGAGSFQNQGANVMSLLSGQQGQQMAARQAMLGGFQGGPTGAIRGISAGGGNRRRARTDRSDLGRIASAGYCLNSVVLNSIRLCLKRIWHGTSRALDFQATVGPRLPVLRL